MDDYIELSSESSLENSSSDEDEGSIQLAEVNNNIPSKNAEAQVLSAKDVYKIMETKLKTVCDVTDVSVSQTFQPPTYNSLFLSETSKRNPLPSFAE